MRRLSVLITGMAALAFGQMAGAGSLLAPGTDHAGFNCVPLGSCFDPGRYQQVYSDTIFTAVNSGLTQITQIAFSVQATSTALWGGGLHHQPGLLRCRFRRRRAAQLYEL